MKVLITGATGFIGRHLLQLLAHQKPVSREVTFTTIEKTEIDLLSNNAAQLISEKIRPTHVLHLAWARTGAADYDQGKAHSRWAGATLAMIQELAGLGIVSWTIGTGLEEDKSNSLLSPYGQAKLELKKNTIDLRTPLCRWVSMPYVFSLFHQRPRIVKSCLQGESLKFPNLTHDYLEIRDVAHQLMNTVYKNDADVVSITSNRQTSNALFCSRIIENKDLKPFNSCSCLGNNHNDLSRAEDHFTSLLLD